MPTVLWWPWIYAPMMMWSWLLGTMMAVVVKKDKEMALRWKAWRGSSGEFLRKTELQQTTAFEKVGNSSHGQRGLTVSCSNHETILFLIFMNIGWRSFSLLLPLMSVTKMIAWIRDSWCWSVASLRTWILRKWNKNYNILNIAVHTCMKNPMNTLCDWLALNNSVNHLEKQL